MSDFQNCRRNPPMPTPNARTLAELRAAMTPGPWIAADDNFIRRLNDKPIAEFFGAAPQRQNRKNAVVVASVPELLDVLEAAHAYCTEPYREDSTSIDRLWDAVMDALFKLGVRP